MGLRGFERRLEGMVEGVFARVFRSGLRPIELGRRLAREMDGDRSVDVRGRTVVPNWFTISLASEDHERFAEIEDSLARELCDAAREHAQDEDYAFLGPVGVELVDDPALRPGAFRIDARLREGAGGVGAGSLLLPGGERYVLGDEIVHIGRMPECEITLSDTNVSRHHAEIHPRGDGFALVDLGSTNGSKVNGIRVADQDLRDGDELAFGNLRLVFQAS